MREKLIEELVKEVYGPRDGVEETIAANPFKEYITGVIIPRDCSTEEADPDTESTVVSGETDIEGETSDDSASVIRVSNLDPQMRPKSFGVSFSVRGNDPSFKICATWARYTKNKARRGGSWKRRPFMSIQQVSLKDLLSSPNGMKTIPLSDSRDNGIELHVRSAGEDNHTIFVSFVNATQVSSTNCIKTFGETSVFQPSLRVIIGGAELSDPRGTNGGKKDLLSFLYRKRSRSARGHMCSAIWADVDYSNSLPTSILWPDGAYFGERCRDYIKPDVRSEFVPLYQAATPQFVWDESITKQPTLSAERLSNMWTISDIDAFLGPLADGYEAWITGEELQLASLDSGDLHSGTEIVQLQKTALQRLRSGIELLKADREARLAFCFANRVISLQYRWKNNGKELFWYPFQLAFFVMNLESVNDRSSAHRDTVDLLWIPTGGGKTEGYLALVSFVMALRRRRARMSSPGDYASGGTAVITRYTLRLLTTQQFRRTLGMMTAAEYLRVMPVAGRIGWRPDSCDIHDDWLYGSERFSAAMWVGGGVTPNRLRTAAGAIDALRARKRGERSQEVEGEPAQIVTCPVCREWLAVPNAGLPQNQKLYLVVKTGDDQKSRTDRLDKIKRSIREVKDITLAQDDLPEGFATLTVAIDSADGKMHRAEIDALGKRIATLAQVELIPFAASRPGYFGCDPEPGRKAGAPPADFDVYCPNPQCTLNKAAVYREGVPSTPANLTSERFPDGLVARQAVQPFAMTNRIPIPALTVDEQIYHRCPTVIVSTADKIARLAFEPRAASIFGNVERYNACYGYYRNDLLPQDATQEARNEKYCTDVKPFSPPELIIQDELHLMEGPLGSMFGLYEAAVEAIIRESWEKLGQRAGPKYIASTATVKNADFQARNLFARTLLQFPPHGLSIDDSFFVRTPQRTDQWENDPSGRIYAGVCTPGMGQLTSTTRIWARLLKTRIDNEDDESNRYFRTIVGYFNAIRELGGARALYREDIVERLSYISDGKIRLPENIQEISSRTSSTDIPQLLEELEAYGEKGKDAEAPDALFTTSMFGTGVDIPHLSLMIVNGQPKTTSQYIQATGRVGRRRGGLIVTFLKASRPRDMNHYEMFARYHDRTYLEVEPVSVLPFSMGALRRASGPVTVSFLRNKANPAAEWYANNGAVILDTDAKKDTERFLRYLVERLKRIGDNIGAADQEAAIKYFNTMIERWKSEARKLDTSDFVFWEPSSRYRDVSKNVVLGDLEHQREDNELTVIYVNAPQSLREIEETTGFEV
jgi:hypothetical protein